MMMTLKTRLVAVAGRDFYGIFIGLTYSTLTTSILYM